MLDHLAINLLLDEKLRDVLQEREGKSLNYFKVYFNYIEQFSCSILLYLGLSQSILDYLGLSRCIFVHLSASRSISVYLRLSRTISDYLGLSWTLWTIFD